MSISMLRAEFRRRVEESLKGPVSDNLWDDGCEPRLAEEFIEAERLILVAEADRFARTDATVVAVAREKRRQAIVDQADIFKSLVLERQERTQRELNEWAPFAAGMRPPLVRSQDSTDLEAVSVTKPATLMLSRDEQHRSWVFSTEIARIAQALRSKPVERFRQRALGGRPLSFPEAIAWLQSPLVAFANAAFLNAPLRSTYPEETLAKLAVVEPAMRSPQQATRAVLVARDDLYNEADEALYDRVVIDISGTRVTRRREWNRPQYMFNVPPEVEVVEAAGFEYWDGSLLAELVREGGKVAYSLPWSDAGGAWFILTGHAPDVIPIQGKFTRTRDLHWTLGVLTIEVEPWVSEHTVLSLYRAVRHRYLPTDERLPIRALAVWQFHAEQTTDSGRSVGYAESRRRWNAAHPEWPYNDYSQFVRDVKRGRAHGERMITRIVRPDIRDPDDVD